MSASITSGADIDALIQQLHEIKAQAGLYAEIEISFVIGSAMQSDRK